jgi:hypothetical protein
MSLLLAAIPIIDTISLGWSLANDETSQIAIYALNLAFSLYILILAVYSVNQNTVDIHSESILHLTTMNTLAATFLGSTAILPDTSPIAASLETVPALRAIWHAKLCLYTIVCIMAFTTPQGPRLRFPPERIYSDKTILATTNPDEENVCGLIGMFHYLRL